MDKYDIQVETLTKYPSRICGEWGLGQGLFSVALGDLNSLYCHDTAKLHVDQSCGCLTQIRSIKHCVVLDRPDLTERIKADTRIPKYPKDITVESLPVFAEWQRILDVELGRPVNG